jgi:hypothetical protein
MSSQKQPNPGKQFKSVYLKDQQGNVTGHATVKVNAPSLPSVPKLWNPPRQAKE